MIAYLEGDVLVVKGSMQCPYYVLKALQHALARDETRVRVIQTPTGGGFGGKEEFPSHIALHAALLALKSGRPVKLIYDRGEDMAATTKRHPARVRSEEHTSELQSPCNLVCRLLLEKKKTITLHTTNSTGQ